MKIGIIVVYHNFVNKFILPCLNSILDNVKCEKFIGVFDNESDHNETYKVADFCSTNNDFIYIRIDDQNKNGGLTGAWNKGIDLCIQKECNIIFIINDDILINDTWRFFVSSIVNDNVIYGPVSNKPGHAWVNRSRRWTLNHLLNHSEKRQYANKGKSRNENPEEVGFVNGFCFGCTTKTFVNNMYDNKHYFNPNFPFGGNETEFQLRLFNLKPTDDEKRNLRILDSLGAHSRAVIVPRCYVYHYKNHAWNIGGGGKYSKEQFI